VSKAFIHFFHNKKYSRQQNGIVGKNNYMLVENVQSFKRVMQAHLNHFGRQTRLWQLQHVCEGIIKYKEIMHCKMKFTNDFFLHKQKSIYIYKFHFVYGKFNTKF
jgi:hypothetical protein